jgi:TRAP-type mannitol/chloroaromatic compound transport system permease small subunit
MLKSLIIGVDRALKKQGEFSSFVIYPLVIIVIYEVFMRYVFNAPTIWGFEATAFAYGVHYMLGLSYTENQDGNVKVDILTSRLSDKTRAVLGILTYAVIFLPVFFFMTVGAIKFAYTSTAAGELNSTSWAPPLYPFKIIMAIGFLFLLLQGLSSLLKHVQALINPNPNQQSQQGK